MHLDEFKFLLNLYNKGAKKISFRESYLKINSHTLDLQIDEGARDYDLHFNEEGLLLDSIHKEFKSPYKNVYYYDQLGKIIKSEWLDLRTNRVQGASFFKYDNNERIVYEETHHFLGAEDGYTSVCTHEYDVGKELCVLSVNENSEDAIFTNYYDNKGRLIEKKANLALGALIEWEKFDYDEQGNIIKVITLNENGDKDGVYDYFPYINNLETGYKRNSQEYSYIRRIEYVFNERGHWISKLFLNDGELLFIYDREIEYY